METLLDQYSFKPTGSTTAALTYFMHQVNKMLGKKLCSMPDD